jgi:hypothetical protein
MGRRARVVGMEDRRKNERGREREDEGGSGEEVSIW